MHNFGAKMGAQKFLHKFLCRLGKQREKNAEHVQLNKFTVRLNHIHSKPLPVISFWTIKAKKFIIKWKNIFEAVRNHAKLNDFFIIH